MDFAQTWSNCSLKQVLQTSDGLQKCIFWRQYCCSRAECTLLQYYLTLHCPALHYNTLHYITLHYITLNYMTLHYITVHYIILHYITLHYTTLHYSTLHYTTLDYTVVQGPVCEQCTNHAKHLPGSCNTSALHCSLRSSLYCTVNYNTITEIHCTALLSDICTVLYCELL